MIQSWLTFLFLACAALAQADVALPKVIDSKMVLQRDRPVPIWGWADPGEEVTVAFAGQVKKAVPDASGKWLVQLDPLTASAESRRMVIKGRNEIALEDVLVGEVWLASGQSNMEWPFASIDPAEWAFAQTQGSNRFVRAFHVDEHLVAGFTLDDTIGQWKDCAEMVSVPHSVSAVAFFFALKLQKELGVPVAFLDASWGGRTIESFIPDAGYQALGLPYRKDVHARKPAAEILAELRSMAAALNETIRAAERGRMMPIKPSRLHGSAENEIHHAMIGPLAPYGIRGAIWYQGESNHGSPNYFQKLQALSAGWSQIFQVKDIPILQVQIAPYDYRKGNAPNDSVLCDTIWAAQYRGAQEIPGMGIVAIHDTGIDSNNIHPKNKLPVGERLAALALQKQYGKDVVAKGPSFASAKRSGSKVVVAFHDVDQGLTTFDQLAPSWFDLSADGVTFVPAEAAIVGDTVEVHAPGVPEPNFVRMGWRDVAVPNLKDKNGWPVFAFAAQRVTAD
jgi:sialate O-acetylesterase